MDVKTLKFLMSVLMNRHDYLSTCLRNCCSWERGNIEGRLEENNALQDYVRKSLSRNERRIAKSKPKWIEVSKRNPGENGEYFVVTMTGHRLCANYSVERGWLGIHTPYLWLDNVPKIGQKHKNACRKYCEDNGIIQMRKSSK